MRDPGGSRSLLGEARGGRRSRGTSVRLVERQIRALLAARAEDPAAAAESSGQGQTGTRVQGDAADEEAGYCDAGERVAAVLAERPRAKRSWRACLHPLSIWH